VKGWIAAALLLSLSACSAPPDDVRPNAAGLVRLPCHAVSPRPVNVSYCLLGRNYVTLAARSVVVDAAGKMAARYPGFVLFYMDASGADGRRPFAPHLSHGDGREVDLALVYDSRDGRPLAKPPTPTGYYANINPRPGDPLPCRNVKGSQRAADPPPDAPWRLDEPRTRDLATTLIQDTRVKRIFLEPHLKLRLGLGDQSKVRFQGCWAGRHDDHIHVDVL